MLRQQSLGMLLHHSRSVLRLLHSCKLELGTTGLAQRHVITEDFQLINRRSERRLDLDSVLIAEPVSAASISDEDGAVLREFPNRFTGAPRHAPFSYDFGIPAASNCA
jgi:hypothetical protein